MNRIDGKTKLYAVMGDPIEHSLSPLLHNTAFEYWGLNCSYVAFRVEAAQIQEALKAVVCLRLGGANLTHPLKEVALPCLNWVDEKAQRVGAVNTVVNREGSLLGYNTDVEGFRWSLEEEAAWNSSAGSAVILGAGGAARGVTVSLAEAGVRYIRVHNRNADRAAELSRMLHEAYGICTEVLPLTKEALRESLKETRLLVNTLPLDPCDDTGVPLYQELSLTPETVVFDIRYSPPVPSFLHWARNSGGYIFNGLGMLMGQAAEAFEYFTGKKAPRRLMLEQIKPDHAEK